MKNKEKIKEVIKIAKEIKKFDSKEENAFEKANELINEYSEYAKISKAEILLKHKDEFMEYFSRLINIKTTRCFYRKKETYAFNNDRYLIKEYSRSANINKAEIFSKDHKNKFINYFNRVIQRAKEI